MLQCRSREQFQSIGVQSIFKAAGLELSVKETQRAGHATEMVRDLDLDSCDALVTAGGDGTVFEALQVEPIVHSRIWWHTVTLAASDALMTDSGDAFICEGPQVMHRMSLTFNHTLVLQRKHSRLAECYHCSWWSKA